MTTNLTTKMSKTRERHSANPRRKSKRPASKAVTPAWSADEIRDTVKAAVGKGIAAVAGVVEGVSESLEESHLTDTAESAIHQVGQMGNKVVRAAKEEAANFRHALKGEEDESSKEDADLERDDPTFKSFGSEGEGAASPYGAPISYGAGNDQFASTYAPSDADDEDSQGI